MNMFFAVFGGILVGGFAALVTAIAMVTPSDDDYLVRTAGFYSQAMSRYGSGYVAGFRDCKLTQPNTEEGAFGAQMRGVCNTSSRGTGFNYVIFFDQWGRMVSDEFEVVVP